MASRMAKDQAPSTPFKRPVGNIKTVNKYAAQCGRCFKWRSIETLKEFEVIRSKFKQDPFYCEKKNGVSCDEPADLEYDASRTWVMHKPNLPRTPARFKRELVMRKDHSKMDVYYVTPTGKRLRSITEIPGFLKDNPEFSHLSVANFSFTPAKVMEDTIPDYVERKESAVKDLALG